MTVSIVLDVVLGLFVVYFIISSMSSVINELIATLLNRRAKNMAQFILEVFPPAGNTAAPQFTPEGFYKSAVFNQNQMGSIGRFIAQIGQRFGMKPSVVGSETVIFVPSGGFSQAVFEVMNVAQGAQATYNQIQEAINNLPDSPVKTALRTAAQQAGDNVEQVAANLEKWFDGQMAQLSEVYKQNTRILLFIIGLGITMLFNADSLAIYHTLQNNPGLREAVVEQTKALIQTEAAEGQPLLPGEFQSQLDTLNAQLSGLGLPIQFGAIFSQPPNTDWGAKLLGLLVTSAAVTMGAPFWFDVLKLLTGRGGKG